MFHRFLRPSNPDWGLLGLTWGLLETFGLEGPFFEGPPINLMNKVKPLRPAHFSACISFDVSQITDSTMPDRLRKEAARAALWK